MLEINTGFNNERMGFIEERPDLFETKILELERSLDGKTGEYNQSILVASRDPGSANALIPVVRKLGEDQMKIDIITDGRALDIFKSNFQTKDLTPKDSVLEADKVIGTPDVILTDTSANKGIEGYATSTFKEVPLVLLEDYYGSSVEYLQASKERYGRLPNKICVMDEEAAKVVIKSFPELVDRIEITGQPAFDSLATEETEVIQKQVKEKLNLKQEDKLVVLMSTNDVTVDQIEKTLSHYESVHGIFLAFRKHPRDNTSYEEYYSLFSRIGINYVDVEDFSSDEIGAAADLVITTWSTEGLKGIYRRKPTIHLCDASILDVPPGLEVPFPLVKLGASEGVSDMNDLTQTISLLLDKNSEASQKLRQNMERYYPADGKNAERVVGVVKDVIESSRKVEVGAENHLERKKL
jgi:hypothetical protein